MFPSPNRENTRNSNEQDVLIRRAVNGDQDAASQLFERHRPMISSYLARKTRGREDADELVQETFVRASTSLASYRGDGPFSSWLQSIAVHLVLNYYERTLPKMARSTYLNDLTEKDSTEVQQHTPIPCPYKTVDRQVYVEKLLQILPITCTDIESDVIQSVYQGCDYETISLLLNIGQNTARQHFLRGRGKLLAYLVEHDPEMLGGKEMIAAAWRVACESVDVDLRPSRDEQVAWHAPEGQAKMFRKAVLKMVRFLTFAIVVIVALLTGSEQ